MTATATLKYDKYELCVNYSDYYLIIYKYSNIIYRNSKTTISIT